MALHSGYLLKKSQGANNKWIRRFCVLDADSLTYYEDESATDVPKGSFGLSPLSSVTQGEDHTSFAMYITTPDEATVHVQADSQDALTVWCEAIAAAVAVKRQELLRRIAVEIQPAHQLPRLADMATAAQQLELSSDDVYEVQFLRAGGLGFGFRQAGDWAVVSQSTLPAVTPGSIVEQINGTSVLLATYSSTRAAIEHGRHASACSDTSLAASYSSDDAFDGAGAALPSASTYRIFSPRRKPPIAARDTDAPAAPVTLQLRFPPITVSAQHSPAHLNRTAVANELQAVSSGCGLKNGKFLSPSA